MTEPRFSRGELGDAFGAEADDALEMGRFLQASIDESAMSLPGTATGFDAATEARGGLGDRVMAALADEPAPATGGFLLPVRRRGFLHGLGASVRQAWVGLGGSGRPMAARAAALAYVLAVAVAGVSLTGAATIGAGSLLGVFGEPTRSPAPTLPAPTIAPPATPEPTLPPSVSPEVSPSPSPSPSESPEASDDHGSGTEPSDDHGGSGSDSSGSGSDSSGSGSDDSSGSGSGSSTPKPTQTPKPSETPH